MSELSQFDLLRMWVKDGARTVLNAPEIQAVISEHEKALQRIHALEEELAEARASLNKWRGTHWSDEIKCYQNALKEAKVVLEMAADLDKEFWDKVDSTLSTINSLLEVTPAQPIKNKVPIPDWFGPALGAAQHQDRINSWPWWARFLHRKLRAHKCPACIYWKQNNK